MRDTAPALTVVCPGGYPPGGWKVPVALNSPHPARTFTHLPPPHVPMDLQPSQYNATWLSPYGYGFSPLHAIPRPPVHNELGVQWRLLG